MKKLKIALLLIILAVIVVKFVYLIIPFWIVIVFFLAGIGYVIIGGSKE